MKDHGQSNGIDQDHVVPKRKSQKRFARGEGVHGVKHLDNYQAETC